jgi:hypothetical protein
VSLEGVSGGCLWRVSLEGVSGGCLWRVSLEGVSGGRLWRVSLEGVSGGCLWRVSLEGVSVPRLCRGVSGVALEATTCALPMQQIQRVRTLPGGALGVWPETSVSNDFLD